MTTITAKVTPQQEILVTSYRVNTNSMSISDLADVSAGTPPDGALLAYNGDSGTWEAIHVIENPNIEFNGGHF